MAPAKINLGLKVFPKRADGYHDIASIFSTVSLCDSVTVELLDGAETRNCCIVDCDGMILPDDNTLTKTYKAFCVLTGIDRGVHVKVEKKIPAGGGLGGGSSDSSAFLKSIDILFGTRLSNSDLMNISGKVGSDVFFFTEAQCSIKDDSDFLGKRFSAFVSGRGEKIKRIEARNDFSVLLVFPGESVSTPLAYRLVDSRETAVAENVSLLDCNSLESVYRLPVVEWTFENDFTVPVAGAFPKVGEALECLRSSGADFVDMSGSGSTVFGVFADRDQAVFAKRHLEVRWRTALV